jgi:hypothetical protein
MDNDFDIDVLIDERIEQTEKGADAVVDAHAWIQEARALPERLRGVAPPLTEMEALMANNPQYAAALKERTKLAQLDAIDKVLRGMPKPEHVAAAHPVTPEPEPSFGDQLAVSNLYAQINLGLTGAVVEKIEATLAAVARDPYPSPKLALLKELLPLANGLDLKKLDGERDYNTMAQLRVAAMRAADLLLPARAVIIERARQALDLEHYKLRAAREAVEEYGDWNHEKNMRARLAPLMPEPSQRRMDAEARRVRREQKAAVRAAGFGTP